MEEHDDCEDEQKWKQRSGKATAPQVDISEKIEIHRERSPDPGG
jgi:hypothetical protein